MSAIYAMKTEISEPIRSVEAIGPPVRRRGTSHKDLERIDHTLRDKKESMPKWNAENLKKQTDKLNQIMDIFNRKIRFFVNSKENKVVVKIIDSRSGEVIRQIPPEKMINFMNRINNMIGFVLDEKA